MEGIITALIAAIIPAGVSLVGVLVSNAKSKAVTDLKIEALTQEVREHNNFARRMPVVEEKISVMQRDIEELKSYHK